MAIVKRDNTECEGLWNFLSSHYFKSCCGVCVGVYLY